jgi:hypothetical protein
MIMCWLTPKSFEGSSEKALIARFALSSQSPGSERLEVVENDAVDDEGRRRPRSLKVDCEARPPHGTLRFLNDEAPLRADAEVVS